jgi:four helix bundle protein
MKYEYGIMKEKERDIVNRTFNYSVTVVKFCKKLESGNKEFILSKQLLRSATSVGANIREAQNAESKMDFIHKMGIAQKEMDESIYWIDLITATEKINIALIEPIRNESIELLKIIRTIILNTKKNLSS